MSPEQKQKRTYRKKEEYTITPTQVPPHNKDAEQLVLGALILEKDTYPLIGELLRPECFYDHQNRLIFEAIRDLAITEKAIDVQTVIERLKKNSTLEEAGGVYYVSLLASQVNSTAHVEEHARILYDKAIQRDLISFGNEVVKNAYDESLDVVDTMQEAESKLFAITQQTDKDEVEPVSNLIKEAINQITEAANKKQGISGINTGFRELDEATSGWHSPDLIIIAARPAMGKTAFVLSMARSMAVDFHIPIAIFSLEMSKAQIMTRLIVNHLEIDNDKIKKGNITAEEVRKLTTGLTALEESPIHIDDNAGLSIFDLRSKARRLVRESGIKVIIIDYLQLMTASGMRSNSNREQEVSTISRSLKQLAKELNIPVIALSQLNRGVENRTGEGKRPQLSDLRESGAIEQDADMVCFIHRPDYYGITEDANNRDVRGLAEFIIAKHRNGPTGSFYLRFVQQYIKFSSALDSPVYDSSVVTARSSAFDHSSQEDSSYVPEESLEP